MGGLQGLAKTLLQYSFANGLAQRLDQRVKGPEQSEILYDAEFDVIGALRTRYPYLALSTNVVGGGHLTDNGPIRKVFDNGGELVALTQTALYSWVPAASAWALRDTHLASVADEIDLFNQNGDQTGCDRAELNGIVVEAWNVGGFSSGSFVAAYDKATGAVALPPTQLNSLPVGAVNVLRVVALQTKILLFSFNLGGVITALAIDPANLATSVASAPVAVTNISALGPIDVVQIPGSDSALLATSVNAGTSYTLATVTAALAVTTSSKARPCDGKIAIAVDPNGAAGFARVMRVIADNVTVQSDLITVAGLVDTAHLNQVLGTATATAVSNLTGTFIPAGGGLFTLVAFWSYDESTTTNTWVSMTNTVDGSATVGTPANFVRLLGVASRAFTYGSHAFFWGVFASATGVGALGGNAQLQNTNLLYRDDGMLVGKCVTGRAGGYISALPLPGVQALTSSTFAWCATVRRIVPTAAPPGASTANAYSGRAPCSVPFAFDDLRARRSVRLGKTCYFSGAQIEQYDGVSIAELGWPVYPWYESIAALTTGGALAAGPYAVKATVKSANAVGEVDRSTTATVELPVATTGTASLSSIFAPVFFTRRTKPSALPTLEVWRTQVNPVADSEFFLVSSLNPLTTANPNRYVANDPTVAQTATFVDALADTAIALLPANPENGNVLPNICPPPARVVAASTTRMFLGDIPGSPDTVWYSNERADGFVASFNPALSFIVPSPGGKITAIIPFNGALVVARQTALYMFGGDGFDKTLGGSNYQLSQTLAVDIGVQNQESYAVCDDGIYFKSDKGWYLLGRGWDLEYIGAGIAGNDPETAIATHATTTQQQIRAVTAQNLFVYDTLVKKWTQFTVGTQFTGANVSACMWNGQHVYTDGASVFVQQTSYAGVNYGIDVESGWIKLDDLQGRGYVYALQILGEWRDVHFLRIRMARDYQIDPNTGIALYYDDFTWDVTQTVLGGPEQVRHQPSEKRCQSVKVRVTAVGDALNNPATTEALRLTGFALDVGLEQGLFRGISAGQEV